MGSPTGFIEIQRKKHPTRPIRERVKDWREVYLPYPKADLQLQGARLQQTSRDRGVSLVQGLRRDFGIGDVCTSARRGLHAGTCHDVHTRAASQDAAHTRYAH